MTTFSETEAGRPPGFVVVPPEAWATSWEERPREEVCLGLRFVPDADLEDARVEAFRRAEKLFPRFRETEEERVLFSASFNDTLLRWVISRGTCDPNDARSAWEGWSAAPEDIAVELALSDAGAQLIFDAWEKMRIEADIGLRAASDEDLSRLPELLRFLPHLSRPAEQRARRLLRYVLEALEEFSPPPPDPDPPAEPEAASTRVDAVDDDEP